MSPEIAAASGHYLTGKHPASASFEATWKRPLALLIWNPDEELQ
jgi:hypothetical protein